MKNSLEIGSVKNILKQYGHSKGWSLCIGAGTSIGVFPDWNQLIEGLIEDIDGADYSTSIKEELINKYSLDSILQAGFELKGISEDEFAKLLSDLLYKKVKSMLSSDEFETFTAILSACSIDNVSKTLWRKFFVIRDNYLKTTSAYIISKVITSVIDEGLMPSEIITFNAEPLLFALINSFIYEKHIKDHPNGDVPVNKHMALANRSISPIGKGKIPYIFNHGVLPVPTVRETILSATDKLVFTEGEYLGLANNAYSWQSSMFLQVCSSKPVIFIGVSLSDPNMRRWLSWIQKNRSSEIKHLEKTRKNSTLHYWIQEKPIEKKQQQWIEASVYHLGVRVIWIDKWNNLETLLNEMVGLY